MDSFEGNNDKRRNIFERRLIREVRHYPQLYDPASKNFSNINTRKQIWENIATKLKCTGEICRNVWAELREQYQRYVRRLNEFFHTGNKEGSARPTMKFETELIFLWRFISKKRKHCQLPYENQKRPRIDNNVTIPSNSDEDDDIIMIVENPIVIHIDDDDISDQPKGTTMLSKLASVNEIKRLAETIAVYPELYNPNDQFYQDYKRKGIIWNAVANELNDKSTKLMKLWFHMQTRYEWELFNMPPNSTLEALKEKSDLLRMLSFLESYININQNTVYKQSHYLKNEWYQPIESFKSIFNLIATLKKYPALIEITEVERLKTIKSEQYITYWEEVAKLKGSTAGQCEVTWLILRLFYYELNSMRMCSYQLQDKWFFESIVAGLYSHVEKVRKSLTNADATKTTNGQLRDAVPLSLPVIVSQPKALASMSLQSSCSRVVPLSASMSYMHPKSSVIMTTSLNNTTHASTTSHIQSTLHSNNSATASTCSIQPAMHVKHSTIPTAPKSGVNIKLITAPSNPMISSTSNALMSEKSLTVQSIQLPAGTVIFRENATTKTSVPNNKGQVAITKKPALIKFPKVAKTSVPISPQKMVAIPVSNYNKHINPLQLNSVTQKNTDGNNRLKESITPAISTENGSNTSIDNILPSNVSSVPQFTIPSLKQTNSTPVNTPKISLNRQVANSNVVNPLPKITGAMSLLHQSEIMIQLVSSSSGKQLVVHGPPLSDTYSLSMTKTAKFIREAMSIPQIHNKNLSKTPEILKYWQFLSKRFSLPIEVCKACWNFLAENIEHFPQIAPMDELMKPFITPNIKVWTELESLFEMFDNNASAWIPAKDTIGKMMDLVRTRAAFFKYIVADPYTKELPYYTTARNQWTSIRMQLNQETDALLPIYIAFHNVFWRYMSDLELGLCNKWSREWWFILAKMDFLVEERYKKTQPYYYIVHNKMNEEIQRCEIAYNNDNCTSSALVKSTTRSIDLTDNVADSTSSSKKENSAKRETANVLSAMLQYKISSIDAYNVISAISRYPNIYKECDKWDKINAWTQVAQELNSNEVSCYDAFQRALRLYRTVKISDPSNQCRMTQKYFKDLDKIYRIVKKDKVLRLNIKTPSELNQQIDEHANSSDDVFYPERFIYQINMDNCKTSLVMKNWAYAIGNLCQISQIELQRKLTNIFEKYGSMS